MTPADARMPPTGYAVRPETTAAYQQLEAEIVRLRSEVEQLQVYAAESDTALERLQAIVTKFKQFDFRWEDTPAGCVGFRASVKGVLAKQSEPGAA